MMHPRPKFFWVYSVLIAGAVGSAAAHVVTAFGGTAAASHAAAGTVGYLGALTAELLYDVLYERYTQCRRARLHHIMKRRQHLKDQRAQNAAGSQLQLL